MKNIHAYTEGGTPSYPGYISVNEDEHGKASVTVRSQGNAGRNVATVGLTDECLQKLADDINAHLAAKRKNVQEAV